MNFGKTILVMALSLSLAPEVAAKRGKKSSEQKAKQKSRHLSLKDRIKKDLKFAKKDYLRGKLAAHEFWAELTKIHRQSSKMAREDRVDLLQAQSYMLSKAGYPVASAIYAAQGLKTTENPAGKDLSASWKILKHVSTREPIQNLLEVLAENMRGKHKSVPSFGSDWNYFLGNSLLRKGNSASAIQAYNRIKIRDRYFYPAKYQQAMALLSLDKTNEAIVSLKAITNSTTQRLSSLNTKERGDITDYAHLALARIYYEKREFLNAARMYRLIRKGELAYYDALFEQSWAFFMGGYPAHALGALHSVESPFFDQVFNPEAPVLRAMIHYWLCRYEDSRNSLADFMEHHAKAVEQLADFLARRKLSDQTAYQLFEDLMAGVSSQSLGIPRTVLLTAAETDSLMLVRDQLASILEERSRLAKKGIFKSRKNTRKPMEYLDRWAEALKQDIGRKFLVELRAMQNEYDRLYDQSQFLYVELLMSEKDQLLGKELHASSKMTNVKNNLRKSTWGEMSQAWKASYKNEFWWDEVGNYIVRVSSQCNVPK
jgi:hypothetical protein